MSNALPEICLKGLERSLSTCKRRVIISKTEDIFLVKTAFEINTKWFYNKNNGEQCSDVVKQHICCSFL